MSEFNENTENFPLKEWGKQDSEGYGVRDTTFTDLGDDQLLDNNPQLNQVGHDNQGFQVVELKRLSLMMAPQLHDLSKLTNSRELVGLMMISST